MSIKAKFFHYLLKYRHLLKGKLTAEVINTNTNIEKLRYETEKMAEKLVKPIVGVTFEEAAFIEFYAE